MKKFSHIINSVLASFLTATIVGCSGLPIEEAASELVTRSICCSTYSQLDFAPLAKSDRTKVELKSSSPIMAFEDGRSFVVALSLPEGTSKLSVQSVYPEYLPKTSYIDPVIVFLDRDKNVILRRQNLDFAKGKHVILPGLWEWYFGTTVDLPRSASYVVIYANNRSTRVLVTHSDNGTPWPVPPAPIGTLALIAK